MRRILVLVLVGMFALSSAIPLLQTQVAASSYGHATAVTRQILCNGMPLPC